MDTDSANFNRDVCTSADTQIEELLTDVQYPENIYALKHRDGHSMET